MNMNDDYNIASRYRTIRKHLDSLGYRQALSLDALPLIEKLLADLIQTTDSLKHFKTVAQDNVEACSQLQLSVDPYKCDNARLVRECNQLHLDLIEAKEAHQRQARELKKKIHNLESECNNLQLASSRNLKRIKELETESAQKSKKIQELLGKCCKPLISNAALASKKRSCYPLRRPSLESDPLPRTKANSSLPSLSKVEPKIVDLLAMADRKMNSLNHEVTTLKGELSMHVDNVHTLNAQLAIKEKEILRLKKMLEGGRPQSAVSKDCSCKKIDQISEHNGYEKTSDLHSVCHKASESTDLRMLQQVKSDLEQQLREALDKQHDAMSQAMKLAERNEELEKELRDIDHIALAVEADCNSAVKENNKRVSHLQEKLESVMTQVHVLEGELMVERRSGQELRADMEAERLENRNLQRKLESTLDEKKRMTDRINELTVIEKNLNDEIQRLSRDNGDIKLEVARLNCANNLLKKQMRSSDISTIVHEDTRRVKEKGEKNDKNRGKALMKKKTPVSRGQRRSFSPPVHEKQTEATRRHIDSKDDEVTRDSNVEATRSNSKICQQLQSTIVKLQTDRDYYKSEYNRLREQCTKNSEVDNAELWGQVCELRRQLIEKEQAVLDLQRDKKELCREKFELELRLQSSRSERSNTVNPSGQSRIIGKCACSASPTTNGGDSKAMLERLERERDTARADVDRLVEERDTLRERLKLAVETHKFEQRRLRQNLCDVETRLSHVERERQDILLAQGTQRATIGGFEDQLEDIKDELRRTKQELTTQRTQYFQLRTLQDQADQALGDVQGQLSQTEAELCKTIDRNRLLEQQKQQLDNDVKGLRQEINTIRANVSRGDQEKDQIIMQLDERNERIALLERELKVKDQEAASIEQQFQELQRKNQLCVDQSAEQERRLRNMQMEMEIHQRQLAAASNDRDNAAQENRRLQDDLAAVTCEIRTLQRELEVSRAESYDLKRQLQTYVSEVRRAEDLINRKENERTEMLNHFRSLSLEATMLENNNHSLESEAAEVRSALQSARDRSLDLERQLTDRDCMIKGYETQITELTQNVASLETQTRQQMEQRQRAEADLNAVRDLCVKLDQQKETLVKELGDRDAMKAQYEAQLARLKAEQNMVQDQINRDHVTVERLESLLDQARQESMDSQTANQELQCEISRLKQRMCELQAKLSTECAELRRYQNQAAEYSKQISELRRQVTNERFDRARKDEEHRSNCQCGDSGKATRRESFAGVSSQGNGQPRRLDCSSINVQSGSSPRYEESGKAEEYRSRGDLRIEAQRTNRFETSNIGKVSTVTTCKCTENNGKMYNEARLRSQVYDNSQTARVTLNSDIFLGQTDREVSRFSINDETLRHEQARKADGSAQAGFRVSARLEENKDHKDIRIRISETSACASFDVNNNKASVVKFCTPIVCNEASQRDLSANEAVSSNDVQNQLISTEDKSTMRENEAHVFDRSSESDENLGNFNDTANSEKIPAHRDNASCREMRESLTTERTICQLNDCTSGHDTSKLPKFFCRDIDNVNTNEIAATNDTLKRLQRFLENSSRSAPTRERSSSLPRDRSCERKFHCPRSNISFPVCVDYSEATITAADFTRPEFVRMLTELKEQTRNVEIQLSRVNKAMRGTRLNDDSSDIARVERDGNRSRVCRDKSERQHNVASSDVVTAGASDCLTFSTSTAGILEREKKISRKKKKNRSASSQIDDFREDHDSASYSKITKKFVAESSSKNEAKPGLEGENLTMKNQQSCDCERITDRRVRVSTNRIFVVETKDSPSVGTQTSLARDGSSSDPVSTVNESVTVRPSKIHKLKKQVSTNPVKFSVNERNTSLVDDSRNIASANERALSPETLDTVYSTAGSSSIETAARSMIPKLRANPERMRSSSNQSIDNRAAASTSVVDLRPVAPPTTPIDSEHESEIQRGRRTSRFSLKRLASVSPSRERKNNTETRSRSVDNTGNASIHDTIAFRAINDNVNSNGKTKNFVTTEMMEIDRTRTTPKPFALKNMKKFEKLVDKTKLVSVTGESKLSCTSDNCESSSRLSTEATRNYNRTIVNSRERNVSSNSRQLDDPMGRLFERRAPGMEYLRDENSTSNGQRISGGSSKNSTIRKLASKKKLSLTNYPSTSDRLEGVGSVKNSDNVNEKVNNSLTNDNYEKKSKIQQRSRSDPREARNYSERSSR